MARASHWCFTVFSDEVVFFSEVDYCIFGNEKCPKTGKWHKQGYLYIKKRIRLSGLKKLDGTAHFEMKRGSVQQAIDYCKKDGDFYEQGEVPVEKGSRDGNEFKIVLDLVKEGKYKEIEESDYLGTYIRYKKSFDSFDRRKFENLKEPRGVWIYGKPGIGKDTAVIEKYAPFVKSHNKWWDGYDDEENVLWSDFDKEELKYFYTYFKQWSDRYSFTAEFKGGSRRIHPKKFFVTSNYRLPNDDALKRRFDVINADTKEVFKRPRMEPDLSLKEII